MLKSDKPLSPVQRSDRLDAILWLLAGALILSVLPIGWVSGDGLVQSARYARGSWTWDPNALLLEPLGAWWQTGLAGLGIPRAGVDLLKLLSVVAGALSVGLFRWGFAARIGDSRFAANHATAWFALGSAFSRMWISEEAYMLQMPFLVLAAMGMVWFLERPSWAHSLAIGSFVGFAALFFISNLLLATSIGIVLAISYARRTEWLHAVRAFLGVGIGSAVAAGSVLLYGWANHRTSSTGFLTWLTTYGGGEQGFRRFAETQGLGGITLRSLATSSARTVYGAASAVVDLAPVVEIFRDDLQPTVATGLNLLAFVAAAFLFVMAAIWVFRRAGGLPRRAVRLVTIAWVAQIFLFMLAWDNSDAQFYFQLAIPLGAMVALLPLAQMRNKMTAALVVLSSLALLWNAGDLFATYVMYPREKYVATLRQGTAGSGLIIYPGRDDIDHLLSFVEHRDREERLALTELANQHAPEDGFQLLEDAIRGALRQGQRVDVIGIYEASPREHPWKGLRGIGYERDDLISTLNRFPIERSSRRVGPWTIRSIPARPHGAIRPVSSAPAR